MSKHLCVIADDFGMHEAVNEGIMQALTEGILTDTNLMPPTPAFREAVELTRTHAVPVGLHATFTCEWDRYAWGPLTGAASLAAEGRFASTVEDAWKDADEAEALAEIRAQYDAIRAEGIPVTHVGQHMGLDSGGKFHRVMSALIEAEDVPFKNMSPAREPMPLSYAWESGFILSGPLTLAETKARLIDRLENLGPGYHVWVAHPGIDHPSLDALCTEDCPARPWARTYRRIDLALLLDAQIRDILEQNEIRLTPLAQCPQTRNRSGRP